jgi:phosphoglycolate phosphatase
MARPYDTLLFDLDGTLTDPKVGILESMRHALRGLGWKETPVDEEIEWCIGPPIRENFGKLLGTPEEAVIERALEIYRERFGTVGKFENRVYEGIPEALGALRTARFDLVVATSKPTLYAEQILDKFELRQFFGSVYGSEMDGLRGAKTELLAFVLEQEQVAPECCLMIGDREHDVIGGKANGIAAWGVTWGYGSEQELASAGAARLCHTPVELAEALIRL